MDLHYFKTRRTVRRYSDRPLSDADLREMIEAAARAANTGNMQLYSVIVSRTTEERKALAPAHFNQPSVEGCQAVLTFCADFNRFNHWCRVSDAEPGYDNFQAFLWAVIDTTIFAQQFCTIAEMNGLGTCYLGTTTYNAPQIAQLLRLPKGVVPVTTLTVGYPEGETAVSDRLDVDAIMHSGYYHDYTDDDIRCIYAYKEGLPESRHFVEENGKQTLAQVFTDVRYTRKDNEYFSQVYVDFIRKQGF